MMLMIIIIMIIIIIIIYYVDYMYICMYTCINIDDLIQETSGISWGAGAMSTATFKDTYTPNLSTKIVPTNIA